MMDIYIFLKLKKFFSVAFSKEIISMFKRAKCKIFISIYLIYFSDCFLRSTKMKQRIKFALIFFFKSK